MKKQFPPDAAIVTAGARFSRTGRPGSSSFSLCRCLLLAGAKSGCKRVLIWLERLRDARGQWRRAPFRLILLRWQHRRQPGRRPIRKIEKNLGAGWKRKKKKKKKKRQLICHCQRPQPAVWPHRRPGWFDCCIAMSCQQTTPLPSKWNHFSNIFFFKKKKRFITWIWLMQCHL